jgi:hypothetical protein
MGTRRNAYLVNDASLGYHFLKRGSNIIKYASWNHQSPALYMPVIVIMLILPLRHYIRPFGWLALFINDRWLQACNPHPPPDIHYCHAWTVGTWRLHLLRQCVLGLLFEQLIIRIFK